MSFQHMLCSICQTSLTLSAIPNLVGHKGNVVRTSAFAWLFRKCRGSFRNIRSHLTRLQTTKCSHLRRAVTGTSDKVVVWPAGFLIIHERLCSTFCRSGSHIPANARDSVRFHFGLLTRSYHKLSFIVRSDIEGCSMGGSSQPYQLEAFDASPQKFFSPSGVAQI